MSIGQYTASLTKTPFHLSFFSLAIFIVLIALPAISLSAVPCCIESYVGLDFGYRRMTWKESYGENVYKHGAFQPNVYAGLRFGPYLGAELGYEEILAKRRDVYFNEPATILNIPFDVPVSVRSSVKFKGWHFSLVGFYPLNCWEDLELLGTVGVKKLKTRQQVMIFDPLNDEVISRTFAKSKVIPRLSMGFQYKLTDNFAFRAILIGIEKISPFDLGPPLEKADSDFRTKMKHNFYHNLGIVFSF